MRKKILYIAVGLLLTGCTSDEEQSGNVLGNDNAIVLGVKEVKSPESRAQHTGSMNFTELEGTGFGVYGYKGEYNNESSTPTLFAGGANTQVTFIAGGTEPTTTVVHPGNWKYAATKEALRKWEKDEKYTFFAYAPYMADASNSGPGITSVKTDVEAGDPTISYTVAEDPAESVDLLWGVRTDTKEKSGLPWIDLQQGQTNSAVLFTFYHALCAIGYHAQVIVDKDNNLTDIEDVSGIAAIGTDCKLTIKSITLEPNNANSKQGLFYQTGILNLNNTTARTPNWGSLSGSIGSLVLDGDNIDAKIKDPQTGDTPLTSEEITTFMGNTSIPGVTQSANTQAVIDSVADKERFYMLLPYAAKDYKLTVKYFITYKTGADTYFRSAELTGDATLNDLELKAGIKYYFNMVFGLTTFKLSVLAYDWDGQTINTSVVVENGTSASQSLGKEYELMK